MKSKRVIILIVVIVIAIAGIYGWKEYNRKNIDLAETEAAFRVSATDLIAEFAINDSAAEQKYLGKILQIDGQVKKVGQDQDGFYTVTLGSAEDMSSVQCAMDSAHAAAAASLQITETASIKGILIGYNKDELGLGSDVKLNRCVLEKRNKE